MTYLPPGKCPTCGAELPPRGASAAEVHCAYCRTPLTYVGPQGYHPAAPGASTAHAPPPPAVAGAISVVLDSVGANKIAAIKVIRELTGLGLKESKDITDATPCRFTVPEGRATSAQISARFAAIGVRVRFG